MFTLNSQNLRPIPDNAFKETKKKPYVIVIDKDKKIELSEEATLKKAYSMCEQIIRNSPRNRLDLYNGDFIEFTMFSKNKKKSEVEK